MSESCLEKLPYREYIVSGRVQGVGYRYFVLQAAARYGIRGRVKNLANGKVRVRASGEHLAEFALELAMGPRYSRVDHVESQELSETCGYENFRIE
ncbi:MAG: acylphosphatase [Candidatus Cloacimonetes bacterium]|nr:acylphosphatase [Candidatus Cloacimonadota bacterium]